MQFTPSRYLYEGTRSLSINFPYDGCSTEAPEKVAKIMHDVFECNFTSLKKEMDVLSWGTYILGFSSNFRNSNFEFLILDFEFWISNLGQCCFEELTSCHKEDIRFSWERAMKDSNKWCEFCLPPQVWLQNMYNLLTRFY